jgi:antitoxin (DNA-binding transcriptional repressor) of toxin-antitoxin stability system
MATVSIEEAQAKLPELIEHLAPGEQLVITRNQEPIARLLAEAPTAVPPQRPGPGFLKGWITYMAPDFDAPLEDMRDYME